jgi:methyl-accepting chemotaxis protein
MKLRTKIILGMSWVLMLFSIAIAVALAAPDPAELRNLAQRSAAAAASSLQEQASGLSQVVSVFRLEGGPARNAAPQRPAARPQQPPQARRAIAAPLAVAG